MTGLRAVALAAATPVVLLVILITLTVFATDAQQAQAACGSNGPSVAVDPTTLPDGPIGGRGWQGIQITNAAFIINAGQQLDIGLRGQTIGVMTAMLESSLRVLDRGDGVGPDSRGLFQQRANGAWGTYADRMDPHISSTNFFKALQQVGGWVDLAPTIAAHKVQRNADPHGYAPFWDDAVAMVTALADTIVIGLAPGAGGTACAMTPGAISTAGWTRPAIGPITSRYGPRVHPITGAVKPHTGTDIGAPNDAPIYAAAAGTIVRAGPAGGYGNLIVIDHTGGLISRYAHMYTPGILVQIGQHVDAGQQIGLVGSAGGFGLAGGGSSGATTAATPPNPCQRATESSLSDGSPPAPGPPMTDKPATSQRSKPTKSDHHSAGPGPHPSNPPWPAQPRPNREVGRRIRRRRAPPGARPPLDGSQHAGESLVAVAAGVGALAVTGLASEFHVKQDKMKGQQQLEFARETEMTLQSVLHAQAVSVVKAVDDLLEVL